MSQARSKKSPPRRTAGAGRTTRGKKAQKSARSRLLTWLRGLFIFALVTAALGAAAIAAVLWHYGRDLPTTDLLASYEPPQTTRVVDRNGELLGEVFVERRTIVPMERIPRELVLSVLAAEDADFYLHEGLDYPGLVRAVVRAIVTGRRPRGTSTITQQLVKLLLLSPEQTLGRKIRELILARRIEEELEKDEILHLYLNHINYGHGRYGVQEASLFYFDEDVENLTLAQASLIAGLPQAPTHLSPRNHPEAARRRQRFILEQLERKREEHWPDLSMAQIEAARQAPMVLAPRPEASPNAPEVLVLARRTLRDLVGEEAYNRGGFTIHTTIDLELQVSAREALRRNLEALDERHDYRGPLTQPRRRRNRQVPANEELRPGRSYRALVVGADDEAGRILLDVGGIPGQAELPGRYNPEDLTPSSFYEEGAVARVSLLRPRDPEEADDRAEMRLELGPQGAVVVVEPRSRDILALVGGYERIAGFDRTHAMRQPGSTFKPLVYGLGLRSRHFTPASIVIDAPAVYDQWKPQNYETWNYTGQIRLRDAMARSINVVAIRVIEDVSPPAVVGFARELGITSDLDASLALALGVSEVTPLELTNAYATFAAGGRWSAPRLISRIEGPNGEEVALPRAEPARDVMTAAEAYMITSMLTSVVQYGTARAARRLGRPAAGKTGTSNEARDAWFVGFTPTTVAGVWVGFDDNRPLGRRESGGRAALPVWVDVIEAREQGHPEVDFPMPSGIVTARIDPTTGLLAYEGQEDAIDEVFLDGTAPTEVARPPDVIAPDAFLMEQMGGFAPSESETAVPPVGDGPPASPAPSAQAPSPGATVP
ncbi:MAG: PBP1A family penicillin-binding protein [Deltaproteobacteria bacterium]|nr:PBP1A family penicillin-binding protein [Deltaproteobacteria bacterium]